MLYIGTKLRQMKGCSLQVNAEFMCPGVQSNVCNTRPVALDRHFGGVKLGTGGLVRAYGGAARLCLQQAPRRIVTPKAQIQMEVIHLTSRSCSTLAAFTDQHRHNRPLALE